MLPLVFCRDLRHMSVLSIDPPGCVDIDDALHARPLENGNVEVKKSYCIWNGVLAGLLHIFFLTPANQHLEMQVGVHIADVTHFLTMGSAMDVEASSRATSTYLVDKY